MVNSVVYLLEKISEELLSIFITINFLTFLFLVIANFREIAKRFKKVKKKTWFLLLLIFLLGTTVRVFYIQHIHLISDEYGYMQIGKNLLLDKKIQVCDSYVDYEKKFCPPHELGGWVQPIGWPLLLSVSFLIFGLNSPNAINTNAILGSLSILLVFLITYLLFRREKVGLYSALLFSLMSLHLKWSGTAQPNVTSLFFILLTILLFLIYFENQKFKMLLLAILSLAYTIQIRPENAILLFLIGIMFPIFDPKWKTKLRDFKFWILCLILVFLLLPNFLYLGLNNLFGTTAWKVAIQSHSEASQSFLENFELYGGWRLSEFMSIPLVVDLFILIGLIYSFRRYRGAFIFLLTFFLIFFAISMGYRHSTEYFLINLYFPLILFGALGLNQSIKWILKFFDKLRIGRLVSLFIVLILLISFYPFVKNTLTINRPYALLEVEVASKVKNDINPNCYVIMENPEILASTTQIKAIATRRILEHPEIMENLLDKECVLFYEDRDCSYQSIDTKKSMISCYKIGKKYKLVPYRTYYSKIDRKINYTFYKVSSKKLSRDEILEEYGFNIITLDILNPLTTDYPFDPEKISNISTDRETVNIIQTIHMSPPCYDIKANVSKNNSDILVNFYPYMCSDENKTGRLTTILSLDILPGNYTVKVFHKDKILNEKCIVIVN